MKKSQHAAFLDYMSKVLSNKHYKTPEEKMRRSKGELPKCKTCSRFFGCWKASGRTMKTACAEYDRNKK